MWNDKSCKSIQISPSHSYQINPSQIVTNQNANANKERCKSNKHPQCHFSQTHLCGFLWNTNCLPADSIGATNDSWHSLKNKNNDWNWSELRCLISVPNSARLQFRKKALFISCQPHIKHTCKVGDVFHIQHKSAYLDIQKSICVIETFALWDSCKQFQALACLIWKI